MELVPGWSEEEPEVVPDTAEIVACQDAAIVAEVTDASPSDRGPKGALPVRVVGGSLVIAALANLVLGIAAIVADEPVVGLVACSALGVASIVFVLAEVAGRKR